MLDCHRRLLAMGTIYLLVGGLLGLVGLVSGELPKSNVPAKGPPKVSPQVDRENGYIGSNACRNCHRDQHKSWHASYHRTMTQVAAPESIRASFEGIELSLEGTKWHLEKRGEEFWVRGEPEGSTPPDPSLHGESRVVMVTGSHNYQLYWLEERREGAGMRQFPLVYFLQEGIWMPRKSRFLRPPLTKTPHETGRWRKHCIKCHATHGRSQHLPSHETRVAELGISCEACHGPGEKHARLNRDPWKGPGKAPGDSSFIVNPKNLPHERSSEVCGQCHSIEIFLDREKGIDWMNNGSRYRPGKVLADFQTTVIGRYGDNPEKVRQYLDVRPHFKLENCFWPDGVIRVGGREYHGMLESPCFKRGEMSCVSCHSMHRSGDDARPLKTWANDQLGAKMEGDQACLQCHTGFSDSRKLAAHTHHKVGSSGSRCYNCHMPHTTWGLLGAIRSHTIESPSVTTTVKTGRPNACNQCHLDKTLSWSADKLNEWYGIAPPALTDQQKTVAASVIWAVKGDPVQRALTAWNMGWEPAHEVSGSKWMVFYLCYLLRDPYDAVRFRAQRSLQKYPEYAGAAADLLSVATKAEQNEIMLKIYKEWSQNFPLAPDRTGAELLLNVDGSIDKEASRKLASERDVDDPITLFE